MLDTPAVQNSRNVIQMDAYMMNIEHLNTIICIVCEGRGHTEDVCPTKSRLKKLTTGAYGASNLLEHSLKSRRGTHTLAGLRPPMGSAVRYLDRD